MSEGSRLEAWMKSHKSEVAKHNFYLHTNQPGNSVGSPLNEHIITGHNSKQSASAGTLGERDAAGPAHRL